MDWDIGKVDGIPVRVHLPPPGDRSLGQSQEGKVTGVGRIDFLEQGRSVKPFIFEEDPVFMRLRRKETGVEEGKDEGQPDRTVYSMLSSHDD